MLEKSWLFGPRAICFPDEIIKCHSLRSFAAYSWGAFAGPLCSYTFLLPDFRMGPCVIVDHFAYPFCAFSQLIWADSALGMVLSPPFSAFLLWGAGPYAFDFSYCTPHRPSSLNFLARLRLLLRLIKCCTSWPTQFNELFTQKLTSHLTHPVCKLAYS